MSEESIRPTFLDATTLPAGCKQMLFGLDSEALASRMVEFGEPAFRGKQISKAIYCEYITEISEITTLSKSLRRQLDAGNWQIGRPTVARSFHSADGTERYLIEFEGARLKSETAEAVWMPEGDEGETGDDSEAERPEPEVAQPFSGQFGEGVAGRRATICVSSQIGCAVNCQFCLTAKLGLQRNLTAGEIAGQVVAILDRQSVRVGRDRVNLVFMGMGEPFLNYDNFMAAVRLLVREVGLSPKRMTVSTSGIVPGIERFAQEPLDLRPKLAISLNAPNDTIRAAIMPINRKWPIASVFEAVRGVPLRPRERITFEYVLLGGITDQPEHARELARLIRRTGLPTKVNLIAWNAGPGIAYKTPTPAKVEAFRALLAGEGIPAFIRQPRGLDIFAACGQLKRTEEG